MTKTNVTVTVKKGIYISGSDLFPKEAQVTILDVDTDKQGNSVVKYDVTADKDEISKGLKGQIHVLNFACE